jgi:O-antigen/teichoic acid export membrane protein
VRGVRTSDGLIDADKDVRRVGVNALGLVAQAALPAFHVQLARYLGAAGYGVYAWSAAFVDVFSVVTLFGCDQAVMRSVSLDRGAAAGAVGSALRVVMLSGAFVVALVYWGAPAIAAMQGKPDLVGPLRCLALVPFFYHLATILLTATQALGVMRWAFWARSIAQPLVLLGTTGVALRVGWGPAGAALAVALGMAATAALAAVFYAREMPFAPTLRGLVSGPLDRGMLRVAVPLVAANVLWALVARIDGFFLGHYGTESELGAYAACVLYATSISQLRGAFEPVTSAIIAPGLARRDAPGVSHAIQRQTRWLAYGAFPMAALFIGFGDPLLRIFGHAFTQGVPALAVLAVGHTVNALALASFALPLSGNARLTTHVAAGTLVVQGVLAAVLVPRFGPLGAAIALAVGLVCAQTTQLGLAARVVGVRGWSWSLVPIATATCVALGVGRVVYALVDAPIVARFVTGVGAAATVYAALMVSVGLSRADRSLAMRAIGIRDN